MTTATGDLLAGELEQNFLGHNLPHEHWVQVEESKMAKNVCPGLVMGVFQCRKHKKERFLCARRFSLALRDCFQAFI